MQKYKYSLIIPIYNRPEQIDELLDSLTKQTFSDLNKVDFEIIVVEDGSSITCKHIVDKYSTQLDVKYFFKPNSGQGLSRNFGVENASGDFIITTDSDCILPPHYMETVDEYLNKENLDAFGGPDMAHPSFNNLQKATSYAMTSLLTTGGIRNKKKSLAGKYYTKGFNCGVKRDIFLKIKGYWDFPPPGEEIEFNYKLYKNNYKIGFIENAFVYHKRRTNLKQFFKQVYLFGRRRAMLNKLYPETSRLVFYLPLLFTFFVLLTVIAVFICSYTILPLALYVFLVLVDSTVKNSSIVIGGLSILTALTQLLGYGIGFLVEFISRSIFRMKPHKKFHLNETI